MYGSFSPKIVGKKKLSKSVFGYFKTKIKVPTAIKLKGGGGAVLVLNGPSINKITFLFSAASLILNGKFNMQ